MDNLCNSFSYFIYQVLNSSFHYKKKGAVEELVELIELNKYKFFFFSGVNDAVVSYLYTFNS